LPFTWFLAEKFRGGGLSLEALRLALAHNGLVGVLTLELICGVSSYVSAPALIILAPPSLTIGISLSLVTLRFDSGLG